MTHRYYSIGFSATRFGARRVEGGHTVAVEVTNGTVVSEIDLRTGAVTTATLAPAKPAVPVSRPLAMGLGGLSARTSETAEGPRTELVDARVSPRALVTLEGDLVQCVRAGDVVLAVVSGRPGSYELRVVRLGSTEPPLRFVASAHFGLAAGEGFATASSDAVDGRPHTHVVRAADGRVITIGLTGTVEFDGSDAWVLGGNGLYVVDLAALSFATRHAASSITFTPVAARAAGLREPAKVVMVLGSTILADHPEVGRLNIPRAEGDPTVAAGDAIRIDELDEPLPGVRKVRAWSTLSRAPSVRPGLAPRTIEAPAVAPITGIAPAPVPAQKNREALEKICAQWGVAPPPAMVRFLDATDADAVLRRWLSLLGLDTLEVRDLSTDWDADPCLVAFAGLGTGDELAIYLYPPAFARSEIPVVEYLHESNSSLFFARDFEAFVERWLARRRSDHPEVARLVAARLGLALPDAEDDDGAAERERPAWLLEDGAPLVPWSQLDALRASGDLVRAERGVLGRYLQRADDGRDARAALGEIYTALGWRAARETLERSGG